MNIIDKTESKTAIDFERYRLRRFLAELPPEEIESRAEPIDLAAVAQALDGNPRAVHFHAVGPERHELAGNVTGSRSRIARAFGVSRRTSCCRRCAGGCATSPSIVEVARAEAPAQEIVLTGERRRPHHPAGASAAWRRRRALHLRLDRFRGRSPTRAGPMSASGA